MINAGVKILNIFTPLFLKKEELMGVEIERKYLVNEFDTSLASEKIEIKQGYIHSSNGKVVRVRTFNEEAYITIKYRKGPISRGEFEYQIPYEEGIELLENTCDEGVLEKTRYIYDYMGKKWEIDIFKGKNDGIIIAEIELEYEDESFDLPPFVIREVTGESKYSNHNMAKR